MQQPERSNVVPVTGKSVHPGSQIGALLVEAGKIIPQDAERTLRYAKEKGLRFGDAAIELGLSRVEAGAQGQHKLARGYEPVQTHSLHYIADPGFRAAVADFLVRERAGVAQDQLYLGERTPFRKN